MVSVCFHLSGEAAEVLGAHLLPFAGIDELGGESVVHLLPTLGVDVRLGLLPDGNEVYHFVDPALVAVLHLFHECAPTLHLVRPGHVVKPEEVLLGASGQLVVLGAIRLGVLQGGTTSTRGTVETYTLLVGLVILDGTPFERIAGDEPVGLGAIVVVELEDMVQADGHHVIHTGFATTEHHVEQ